MKDKRLVKLVWLDAADPGAGEGPWFSDKDVDDFSETEVTVTSVGWIKSQTDKYVTLVADWFDDEHGTTWGRPTKVPTKMVVSMVDIGEVGLANGHSTNVESRE